MRLFFEVFSLVLLAAVITVTARAEQLPQSKRDNTPRLIPLPPPAERETRSFGSLPREGNEALRPDHHLLEEVKSLEYYGGAKGQHLIIHPSGQMFISRGDTGENNEGGDDEDVGMEGEGIQGGGGGSGGSGGSDSVTIKPPPDNASIAEAKPVGLAIAGPGGVAASRPSATAVVGPGGLALARPIATAIAGVGGSGGPPIIVSPAGHGIQGGIPPSAVGPAAQNAIQPHAAYVPQFYYPSHHIPQPAHTQPLFFYPFGYAHPHARQQHVQ